MIEREVLRDRFDLPLDKKIKLTRGVIKRFHKVLEGQVYVSFSGGKDSTVLLDLVRSQHPEVKGLFIDTGLEYPEIKDFVKTKDNIKIVRPTKSFRQVIEEHGYPIPTKQTAEKIERVRRNPTCATSRQYMTGIRSDGVFVNRSKISDKWMFLLDAPFKITAKCCNYLKKYPVKRFEKETGLKPYIGSMAGDSAYRQGYYLKNGCTSFKEGKEKCLPLSWWNETDIWRYIKQNSLEYSTIYDKGLDRTGCIFCLFGITLGQDFNRFQVMSKIHPQLFDYCINKLGVGKVLDYVGIRYNPRETMDMYGSNKND